MNSGAWIEQMEVEIEALTDDEEILPNSQIRSLCDFTREMSAAAGRDFQISSAMKRKIEEAGFVDVQEQRLKLPLGPWPTDPKLKDVGRFYERFYKTGLQGWLLQICTRTMGVSTGSSSIDTTNTDVELVDGGPGQRRLYQSLPGDQLPSATLLLSSVSVVLGRLPSLFARTC